MLASFHRLDRVESRLGDRFSVSPEWNERHTAFHDALVAACGSPILLSIRSSLFERAGRYRRISAAFRPTPRQKGAEHRALMEAAIGRRAADLLELAEAHIRQTTANVLAYASHIFRPSD